MPSTLEVEKNIREMVEGIISFCTREQQGDNFFRVEKKLRKYVAELGCLFLQLMLILLCHVNSSQILTCCDVSSCCLRKQRSISYCRR